jgi:hypothetical protein
MKKHLRIFIVASIWLLPFFLQAQDTWTRKSDFGGIGRTGAVSFAIGSKGYIVTGEKYENGMYVCNKDMWEYDPATNIWSQKADFGGNGRYGAVGFSIGFKGYVGWGLISPFSYIDDFWEYDPAANVWTQKADLGSSVSREGGVGFSIGSKGYVGTGSNHFIVNGERLKDFWEYDPAADTWTRKADFGGSARVAAAGFSIGLKGYIGTGMAESASLNDFWEYNPLNDTWTQKAAMGGGARVSAAGFSIGLKGYIGLGTDSGSSLKRDFWEYTVENDSWTKKADFGGSARNNATGFSIGTKGFIGTGWATGDNHYKDFWEYNAYCITGDAGLISGASAVCPGQQDVVYTVPPIANATNYIWSYSGTGAVISGTGSSVFISFGNMATSGVLSVYGTSSCGNGAPSADLPIAIGQSNWTRKADFPGIGRWNSVGFSIGARGYLVTGAKYDNGAYICDKDLWEYDPANGIWSQKADFTGAGRYAAVGFSIGSRGYVGWGLISPFNYINDFWEYDPGANSWTQKADLGITGGREGGIGFSIGNKGYVGTGHNHLARYGSRLNDFWEYDPVVDTWTKKADFGGEARVAAVGFSIGLKGYVGTGASSSILLKDFWEYDQPTNTWNRKADFGGIARQSAAGFSIGNYGYIGTGAYGDVSYDKCKDFWEYSVETDSWTQKPDFGGIAKSEATGFSIGTKGYIGCGNLSGQQQTNDFWEYDPGCQKDPSNIPELANDGGWMQFSIYPNPNNGQFTIDVKTSTLQVFNVEIYNVLGSRLGYMENIAVNGSLKFKEDMQDPATGMYTIVFRNKDKSVKKITNKFIVTK